MDNIVNNPNEGSFKNPCAITNDILKKTDTEASKNGHTNTKENDLEVEEDVSVIKEIKESKNSIGNVEDKKSDKSVKNTDNLITNGEYKINEKTTKPNLETLNILGETQNSEFKTSEVLVESTNISKEHGDKTNSQSCSSKVAKLVDKETLLKRFARHRSWQDFFENRKTEEIIEESFHRNRSNSDGAAIIKNISHAEAFPSLPNSVLEEMGLHGDPLKERTSEIQETEQKFTTLSLAFAIDAATIKDRCDRQRRHRDQTEKNLTQDIIKLKEKLVFLQPLCTDFESAELLSILLSQVERISRAASEVSTAAERYGAVQHEDRLTESVRLMVNYVQALKQQRDSARRQLQCTKKVLQEKPTDSNLNSPTTTQKLFQISNSRKVITRRRASIATTNQTAEPTASSKEAFLSKLNRRTSDLSLRATFMNKNTRPNRLELGGELLKIKEDFNNETSPVELFPQQKPTSECDDVTETTPSPPASILKKNSSNTAEDILSIKTSPSIVFRKTNSTVNLLKKKSKEDLELIREDCGTYQVIREKLKIFAKDVKKKLKNRFKHWSENDYLQAFFNFCAILCFTVSVVTLMKMYLEYEYAKRGVDTSSSSFSWFWSSTPPQNPSVLTGGGNNKFRKKVNL